jgi:hypothetical protein
VDGPRRQSPRRYRVSGWHRRRENVSGEIPMKKQNKRITPAFANEAEEAKWWYENRE